MKDTFLNENVNKDTTSKTPCLAMNERAEGMSIFGENSGSKAQKFPR